MQRDYGTERSSGGIERDIDLSIALTLPDEWGANDAEFAAHVAGIDRVLTSDGTLRDSPALSLRDLAFTRLRDRINVDPPLSLAWPDWLYIPADAPFDRYWFTPAPANRRYAHAWATNQASSASQADGRLSSFASIHPNERYGKAEAGVGIRYTPRFSLGTVTVGPDVDCIGTLRTQIETQSRFAGALRVSVGIVVGQWLEHPGGYDFIRAYEVAVADTDWRDQTFFPLMQPVQQSPAASAFGQPFLVEAARTYLFGVIARVTCRSTLTSSTGGPLTPDNRGATNVWGQLNAVVNSIGVNTATIHLP